LEEEDAGGVMFFTSGTTGRPKGVNAWYTSQPGGLTTIAAMGAVRDGLGVPSGAVTLLSGPAYHTAQFFWAVTATISGAKLVMRHHFDAAETLEVIDQHAVAAAHFVPTQFVRFLRLSEVSRNRFDGSSLVCVVHGAAPCSPDVKRQMIEWWGPKLVEYYGATEVGTSTVIDSTTWLERPGSVGRAIPMCEILIVRDDGSIAVPGEDGQIYVRDLLGRDFEYHGDAGKTASAHLAPGVVTLGDIGHLDSDGYLYLSDRQADLIISGGVNIYPAEIEAILITHPAVADVAVIGVPNDEFGEEVKAIVELTDGFSADDNLVADLTAHCLQRLAGFKVPRSFAFEPSLPRHVSGKLYKRLLRDPYWEGLDRRI
jgi:long-chain acyl-CoA synthetase